VPHAERHNDVISVTTQWTEKELIKQIPGSRWDSMNKIWTVPLSWASCLQLRGMFGDALTVGFYLTQWSYNEFMERVSPATNVRSVTTRVNGDWDKRLYDFQTAGAMFLKLAQSGLLGDDLGMGKTAQILATLKAVDDDTSDAFPALVICPNSVKTGWEKQAILWKSNVNTYIVTGSALQRRKILERAKTDPRALVVINIEAVRLLSRLAPFGSTRLTRCRACDKHGEEKITPARCEVHIKVLNDFGFNTVILDEAHRIKEPSSKQTRACWAVAHDPSVKRRFALTGTPVANHVGDLWSIMHFVMPTEYPTKSKFVDRYGLQAWNAFGGLDIVGINPVTRTEFFNILDARFRRTPKALVLSQLPRVVRATRWVNMSAKQAHAYTEMEKRMITRLDTGEVLLAANNLVNATRLLQLSSSYCEVDEAEPVPLTVLSKCACYGQGLDEHALGCANGRRFIVRLIEPSPKLDAMEDIIDELGEKPVVIAAESRQLIELAAKRFAKRKEPIGLITGSISEFDRQQAIQRFQANQIRAILMTSKAGGTGVDGLQHSDTMICLQRSWSMIDNVQLDGRVDRIGSEKHNSVTIIDVVARDTIEETTQYPRIMEKYERLEEINRDRERLLQAGVSPPDLYALDEREARVLSQHLGMPGEEVAE
jgi:SNF2 family DNA or RNA helicase